MAAARRLWRGILTRLVASLRTWARASVDSVATPVETQPVVVRILREPSCWLVVGQCGDVRWTRSYSVERAADIGAALMLRELERLKMQ